MDAQPPRAPPAAPHARQRRKRGAPRPRGSTELKAGGCRVGPAEAGAAAPGKLRRARRRGWRRRGPAAHKVGPRRSGGSPVQRRPPAALPLSRQLSPCEPAPQPRGHARWIGANPHAPEKIMIHDRPTLPVPRFHSAPSPLPQPRSCKLSRSAAYVPHAFLPLQTIKQNQLKGTNRKETEASYTPIFFQSLSLPPFFLRVSSLICQQFLSCIFGPNGEEAKQKPSRAR